MADIEQSLENACRCCLSDGCCKELFLDYYCRRQKEVYGEMLANVFNINIPKDASSRLICEECITRLRDAAHFKNKVLETQKCFMNKCEDTVKVDVAPFPEVKVEHVKDEDSCHSDRDNFVDESLEKIDKKRSLIESMDKKSIRKKAKKKRVIRETKKCKLSEDSDIETPSSSKGSGDKGTNKDIEGSIKSLASSDVLKTWHREKMSTENTIMLIQHSNICLFRWQRNLYKCFCCKDTFNDILALRIHMETHHNLQQVKRNVRFQHKSLYKVDISSAACKLCAKSVRDISDLQSHLSSTHGVPFDFGENLLIEFRLDGNEFRCELCKETFKVFHKLNVHMSTHYQRHICETCGVTSTSLLNLKEHMQRHRLKIFRCGSCEVDFSTSYQKEQHNIDVHKRVVRRVCPYCPERFKGHYGRLVHMIKMHGVEKPEYKCGSCNKVFIRQFLLNSHIRKFHMKERNHECELCGIKFFGKFDLSQHMTSHTGEKKHMCTVCGKTYARKGTLRDHLKIHDNS